MKTNNQQLAPLFLRLIIGYGFIAHGFVKLSRGPAGFEKLLTQTGVPLPHLTSWVVPFIELIGGLMIVAGAFTFFVAIPLIGTMLVAMLTIQLKFGFSSVNTIGLTPNGPKFGPPGYEINLLYIAGLISLMLSGAGKFSVDNRLINRQK
ncbi:DoxX family protein [Mucilaginibacter corticis]|uniref:DoxX family protein n=1 Tax=Mucilaginibacter corticis TaxID=2597670 RepID=A0A556MUY6_9SPHI|nr:DoxX family protein [Mucilaginibacter corticis]TSJ43662.1 DoxX family protein [Mucilaginibacter corticis]